VPTIQIETSVAAGASNSNLLSGSAYEFLRGPSLISMGVTASATGGFVTIQSGADVVAEEFSPFVATTYPLIPDHMYYNDVGTMGDRLVIRCRNPTGGALTFRAVVNVSPAG
jgi:hypothetical protein